MLFLLWLIHINVFDVVVVVFCVCPYFCCSFAVVIDVNDFVIVVVIVVVLKLEYYCSFWCSCCYCNCYIEKCGEEGKRWR